jgi:hypothetical protein
MKTIGTAMMLGAIAAMGIGSQGCTLKTQDSSRFAEPIPQGSDVALGVPGSPSAVGTTAASASELHIDGYPNSGGAVGGDYAFWYAFTRNVTDGVDLGTASILGTISLVVQLPATSTTANEAVWGPGGDALDPAVWRLTVDEVATDEYDYHLDARPKASTSESDYRALLTGHGYGDASPSHRSGWFQIDQDAYNALEPLRAHDSGTVKVTYDLRAFPKTIEADVKHTADAAWFDFVVTHDADGSGAVSANANGDISTPPDGTYETITLESRYDSTGAGRADVEVTGGDLGTQTVDSSECWGTTFAESYYTDDASWRPTSGDVAACVFPHAAF